MQKKVEKNSANWLIQAHFMRFENDVPNTFQWSTSTESANRFELATNCDRNVHDLANKFVFEINNFTSNRSIELAIEMICTAWNQEIHQFIRWNESD